MTSHLCMFSHYYIENNTPIQEKDIIVSISEVEDDEFDEEDAPGVKVIRAKTGVAQ